VTVKELREALNWIHTRYDSLEVVSVEEDHMVAFNTLWLMLADFSEQPAHVVALDGPVTGIRVSKLWPRDADADRLLAEDPQLTVLVDTHSRTQKE